MASLLPEALLTAVKLTYLGPFPAATQQQLLATWTGLLTQAAGLQVPAAMAAAAAPMIAASAAAATMSRPVPMLQRALFRAHLQVPGSVLLQDAGLTDHAGPLAEELQAAVTAVDVARQPVVVVDPLCLLPGVLRVDFGRSVHLTTTTSSSNGGVSGVGSSSGSSSTGRGSRGDNRGAASTASAASDDDWVVIRPDCDTTAAAAAAAVPASGSQSMAVCQYAADPAAAAALAFQSGRSVCVQLHSLTQGHAKLIHTMAAAWHAQRLAHTAGSTLSTTSGISSNSSNGGCSGPMPSMSRQVTRVGQELARQTPCQPLGAASASEYLPKLLVHVTSPVCHLPSESLSVFSVINIAALCDSPQPASDAPAASSTLQVQLAPQAQQVRSSSHGQQLLHTIQADCGRTLGSCQSTEAQIQRAVASQLVGSVVLPIVNQAAAAALKAAQVAQEKLEERQALVVLQHVAQVRGQDTVVLGNDTYSCVVHAVGSSRWYLPAELHVRSSHTSHLCKAQASNEVTVLCKAQATKSPSRKACCCRQHCYN